MSAPLSPERLAEIRAIATRATERPLMVSDCEGELQVWVESALTHVTRDGDGQITGWSTPHSYLPSEQVVAIDLNTWDPGEYADDDQRRQDIGDLVSSRAALPALLADNERLREFERRVTAEVEEFEAAAKDDPHTPQVARNMIALLRMAMQDGAK